MIGALFDYAGDVIEVRIVDGNIYFRIGSLGGYSPIDGIKISKEGAIKENPELKDDPEWREKSIVVFKNKLKQYPNEVEAMNYVIEDLKKVGYKPLAIQRQGFRIQKL